MSLARLRSTRGRPEGELRAWVEANYTRIPLREKDSGTKLEALYASYFSATPPVHAKILGRSKFAAMLGSVYPGVGPHRNFGEYRERPMAAALKPPRLLSRRWAWGNTRATFSFRAFSATAAWHIKEILADPTLTKECRQATMAKPFFEHPRQSHKNRFLTGLLPFAVTADHGRSGR